MRRMLSAVIPLLFLLSQANGQQRQGPIVTTKENAEFLYNRVLEDGTEVIKIYNNRSTTHYTRTFALFTDKPKNERCLDVKIEAHKDSTWPGIVFDSWCSLPNILEGKTYYVFAQVRVIIMLENGEVGMGSTAWITTNADGTGESSRPDEGAVVSLLRNNIQAIVDSEKKYLAYLEETARKPRQ